MPKNVALSCYPLDSRDEIPGLSLPAIDTLRNVEMILHFIFSLSPISQQGTCQSLLPKTFELHQDEDNNVLGNVMGAQKHTNQDDLFSTNINWDSCQILGLSDRRAIYPLKWDLSTVHIKISTGIIRVVVEARVADNYNVSQSTVSLKVLQK